MTIMCSIKYFKSNPHRSRELVSPVCWIFKHAFVQRFYLLRIRCKYSPNALYVVYFFDMLPCKDFGSKELNTNTALMSFML